MQWSPAVEPPWAEWLLVDGNGGPGRSRPRARMLDFEGPIMYVMFYSTIGRQF